MLAEQRPTGSTGGTARPYDECMRNGTVITLSLFLTHLLACGEDTPTRPEDGTVETWDSCLWDDQIVAALCKPGNVCTYHGVCAPTCEVTDDCPELDGFEMKCGPMGDDRICEPMCDDAKACPKTGGVELVCHNLYCIGDS